MNQSKTNKNQQNLHRIIRWVVLGLVAAVLAAVGVLHQHPLLGWTPPGVDALCPFGGLESLWALLSAGDLMTKVAASSFILLVASVGITVVFRRAFCGQLCPLGAIQGGAAGLGKALFKKKFKLPARLDQPLRWLKYAVLAAVTGLTWVAGTLVIRPYDPWVAFMHLSSAELWSGFWIGALILFGSLVASLFYDRFFCKYLCPMGALYGIVSKLGLYRVRRDQTQCINCGKCDQACPVDLTVSKSEDVTSAECLACGLCVNVCPARGALTIAGPKNTKISPLFLTLATTAVFGLVIAATALPGWFELSKKSLGEEVKTEQAGPVFDPDLIKGRNTFAEIVEQTGIPRQAFEERFQISDAALDNPIKDSNAQGAFTMDEVRNFVAERLGIEGYVSQE